MLFTSQQQNDPHADPELDQMAQGGVAKAEAACTYTHRNRAWLVVAWVAIGIVSYIQSLDNQITYTWLIAATTSYNVFSTHTALSVVQQVLIGVMKLPIARLSDIFGRAQCYILSACCWFVGFIIIAACPSMVAVWAGVAIYATGNTGVAIMNQIILADWVPTRFRGMSIGLLSTPFIINFAVAPKIGHALTNSAGWRWGAGMMSILTFAVPIPIILVLAYSQYRARQAGLTMGLKQRWTGWVTLIKSVDIPGMLLVVAGWLLILLSINLAGGNTSTWRQAHSIVMIVVGPVCLLLLVIWEMYFASEPLIRKRYLINKDVMLPMIIGVTDFFSFYCSWLNVYVWSMIVADFSKVGATYFSNCQSLALTVFGILGGMFSAWSLRYKWQMVFGSCLRILGMGLMIAFRHTGATTVQLVIPQIIQGAGGGILGVQLQAAAQFNVPHADVAMVTAFVLLMTEVGGAIGSAVAGAVQNTVIPKELAKRAPNLTTEEMTSAIGSPSSIIALPDWAMGTPNRIALQGAWGEYWRIMLIIAITVSAVPVIAGSLIKDRKLNNLQSLVDEYGQSVDFDKKSDNTEALTGDQSTYNEDETLKKAKSPDNSEDLKHEISPEEHQLAPQGRTYAA